MEIWRSGGHAEQARIKAYNQRNNDADHNKDFTFRKHICLLR
jgi:hypothetical protein